MIRVGYLFEMIIDDANFKLAWLKASRGKGRSYAVRRFADNLDTNLCKINVRLQNSEPGWGVYRTFSIMEPKPRVISAASFAERVMHHAIMNVLEPFFDRYLIDHCYACRKGKGTHAAVLQCFRFAGSNRYFAKLDVRKYFDSIDHVVLKKQLRRLFKDQRVLFLLDGIIDSYCCSPGKGLPIGNLTSQFFANCYLSGLDHYILEVLHPKGYLRYMDDSVILTRDLEQMHDIVTSVKDYCRNKLQLELKQPVLNSVQAGVPFLGFRVCENGIFLLKKSKQRMKRRKREIQEDLAQGVIDQETAGMRAASVNGAVKPAQSLRFRKKLWKETASGSNRVKRGGNWNNSANNLQVGNRNNNNPYNENNNIGFRVARSGALRQELQNRPFPAENCRI